jgi:sugar phosphate isomerase/epimerase
MAVLDADQPLVLSAYSIGTEVTFEERVSVAAEAGFAGIGLRAEDYWAARETGLDDAELKEILDRHEIAVREVEYLTDWAEPDDRAGRRKEETIFHVAETFGLTHANAGLVRPDPDLSLPVLSKAFAALCRRADGLPIALEFLPYGAVPDLSAAWEVVRRAEQPEGGLLIDFWHWRRSGTQPADLDPVPAERVLSIQMSDVRQVPMDQLRPETRHWREPPGRGYGDVAEIVRILRDTRIEPRIVAVEVMNDDLIARGPDVAARTLMAASRELLTGEGRPAVRYDAGAT